MTVMIQQHLWKINGDSRGVGLSEIRYGYGKLKPERGTRLLNHPLPNLYFAM
jgi:hypothetical protein